MTEEIKNEELNRTDTTEIVLSGEEKQVSAPCQPLENKPIIPSQGNQRAHHFLDTTKPVSCSNCSFPS